MLQANPWGILAVVAVLLCWVLAIVLFRVSTPGSVARKLALLLVFEGLILGSSDAPMFLLTSIPDFYDRFPLLPWVNGSLHLFGDCAMLALYPTFLAAALRTKFTRPFMDRRVRIGLFVAVVSLYLFIMLTFTIFVDLVIIAQATLFVLLVLTFTYAFVASTHAWRISTGTARSRALIFMLAFGFRDLCWGYNYAFGFLELLSGNPPASWSGVVDTGYMAYILGTVVAVPLIAYGILRTQLFDIDLKIRWSIKQSVLGAAVAIIMFIISEVTEGFLSGEVGNLQSFLIAAVVVIFLTPVQRFAERVASAAMPNTKDSPEYAMRRKKEVYEEALAEAQHVEGISERERALLVRLRDSLGLSESDAEAIELALPKQI